MGSLCPYGIPWPAGLLLGASSSVDNDPSPVWHILCIRISEVSAFGISVKFSLKISLEFNNLKPCWLRVFEPSTESR